MRLYYTAQLRQHDMGIMSTGLLPFNNMHYKIPPKATLFHTYGVCNTSAFSQVCRIHCRFQTAVISQVKRSFVVYDCVTNPSIWMLCLTFKCSLCCCTPTWLGGKSELATTGKKERLGICLLSNPSWRVKFKKWDWYIMTVLFWPI